MSRKHQGKCIKSPAHADVVHDHPVALQLRLIFLLGQLCISSGTGSNDITGA
jgi:hypothetical protein